MFKKSKKILMTLAFGSLAIGTQGFSSHPISVMEMVDGQKYDSTNTTSVKARLNVVSSNLDGTLDISTDASNNIKSKLSTTAELIKDGELNESTVTLKTKINDIANLINGTDTSTNETLSTKTTALAGLMSSGNLDGSTVTLTTKINNLGNLINGSDADSTNTISAKIGAGITVGTFNSGTGTFGANDSLRSMMGSLYEKLAGDGSFATLMTTTDTYTAPSTLKGIVEALMARVYASS